MSTDIDERLKILVPDLHPQWRKNQREIIQEIFNHNGKFFAVQATTGFGKSLVAVSNSLLEENQGFIVTQTVQLGEQYVRDYTQVGLGSIKGRNNFFCNLIDKDRQKDIRKERKTADQAPCSAGYGCILKRIGGCDYYDAKKEAAESGIVSMNVDYFLHEANFSGTFTNAGILFIDEAHKLESKLHNFIEVRLSKRRFLNEGLPLPSDHSIESLKQWYKSSQPYLQELYDDHLRELSQNYTNELLIIRGTQLLSLLNILKRFEWVDESWIIEVNDNAIILKPVYINKYTEHLVFRHAEKIVLMSGTLPKKIIKDLGIIKCKHINITSDFDPENRPIIWIPVANLARSAEKPDQELKKLQKAVDTLCVRHTNEKGIIHTSNYRIAQYLFKNSDHSGRMLTHESALDRESTLRKFDESLTNSILVSPSMTEGINLPYDKCRFQIIAKIPYGDLGSKQVAARNKEDPEWYAAQTIVHMVQAYGRIMRAEDDSGVTYILDSSLLNLIKRWRYIFEQIEWFLEALWIQQGNDLVKFNDIEV